MKKLRYYNERTFFILGMLRLLFSITFAEEDRKPLILTEDNPMTVKASYCCKQMDLRDIKSKKKIFFLIFSWSIALGMVFVEQQNNLKAINILNVADIAPMAFQYFKLFIDMQHHHQF